MRCMQDTMERTILNNDVSNAQAIKRCRELFWSFMGEKITLEHMQTELKEISSKQLKIWTSEEAKDYDLQKMRQ